MNLIILDGVNSFILNKLEKKKTPLAVTLNDLSAYSSIVVSTTVALTFCSLLTASLTPLGYLPLLLGEKDMGRRM